MVNVDPFMKRWEQKSESFGEKRATWNSIANTLDAKEGGWRFFQLFAEPKAKWGLVGALCLLLFVPFTPLVFSTDFDQQVVVVNETLDELFLDLNTENKPVNEVDEFFELWL